MKYNAILIRNAEIGLKSRRKRPFFERLLVGAVKEALTRHVADDITVKNLGLRLVIYTNRVADVLPVLSTVPGINSFSPARQCTFEKKADILKHAKEQFAPLLNNKTFRVTVQRTGQHAFTSMQLAKEVADELFHSSAGVDLHNPQITCFVEVRHNDCFFYTQNKVGLGGVPSQATGRALMLFSGGIDSPVAAFQLLKRGCALDFLHIDLVGESAFQQVIPVYNHIIDMYEYNHTPKLFYIPAQKISQHITDNVQPDLRQLALKVAFYELANHFCVQEEYFAFATGEALSQKSTQTLPSLSLLQNYTTHLVLRPLIDKDKLEIIDVAKRIGTWAYSSQVKEVCSLSDGPVFALPHKEDMEKIPDLLPVIKEAVANSKVFEGFVPQEEHVQYNHEALQGVQAIDIRLPAQFAKLPFDDVVVMSFAQATAFVQTINTSQSLAFICQHGVLGAELAYLFVRRGGKAKVFTPKEYQRFIEVHL